jgi:threonine dehydratase
MLKLVDIVRAYRRIEPHISHTPLVPSPYLSELSGANVWLKLEFCQPTGSFKVRGATHKLLALRAEGYTGPLVTASAGNHGLGLAFAAAALGWQDVSIVVPETTPTPKVNKLRRFPVNLVQHGQTYEDAHQAAETQARESGARYIPAYDDPQVIAGAGTCGLEIITDIPQADAIIVPVGGGGLVAGISVAAKG